MMPLQRLAAFTLLALAACTSLLPAEDKKPAAPADDGFKPMFNGKDLSGWINVNCHPDTFFVKGEEVITTGKPMGFLRTEKQYENFVLEMDWMHVNKTEVGNSGLFVWGDPIPATGTVYTRGIEVQVLVNLEYKNKDGKVTATSHGDLFSIWGASCVPDRPHPSGWARCLPSENRAKGGGEWNHYKVTANDGVIKLEVNGKEVSGVSKCTPRKGYLALESEGAECHFKNIKIKELPSTNPKQDEIAKVDEGHRSIFNATDLTGWKTEKDAWKVKDGHLVAAGKATISSDAKYERFELIYDWKVPATSRELLTVSVGSLGVAEQTGAVIIGNHTDGKVRGTPAVSKAIKAGAWNRSVLRFDGKTATLEINGEKTATSELTDQTANGPITFHAATGLELTNVFVRELKEKK